ncbi:MAG: HEAT repeat domain-containing protein [Bryobacteraceae bacterium]
MNFRIATLLLLGSSLFVFARTPRYSVPEVVSKAGVIRTGTVSLPSLSPRENYSLLYTVKAPGALPPDARIQVALSDGGTVLASKTLHAGDADFYAPFHVARATRPVLKVTVAGTVSAQFHLLVNRWPASTALDAGVNHRWQDASPMELGKTVFASGDTMDYVPVPGTSRKSAIEGAMGEDWYRFHFDGARPKLVFFQLELMDRDDLPVDVSVFRALNGKLEEFTDGQDPVAIPHEVQALPGNKFAPRTFSEAGEYYVRVRSNHPEYKLRTRLYNPPPFSDPQEAVQTAVDYIMGAGDSWFANTPRRGGRLDRVASVHQETSLCVACHVSHFSQRAQLYASAHGYAVVQRAQLKFLSDRFYNNPRPFYGFENVGAVWARVISAPANVLSRMSQLTSMFENEISREPRPAYHQAIAKYLDIYYAGRKDLPPDETNGNTPIVSTYEVAWYSWTTTHDARIPGMIATGPVKNMIDLCYQTLALADIDPVKYKDRISSDAARILSLQRPDGQWSMKFDPAAAEVEFQTGHALWALSAAGIPRDNPQVQKGLQYLLKRQQYFGGWFDPKQSFENFRTPFRETQFAVLALSAYYPRAARPSGWGSAQPEKLPENPVELLNTLDQIWDAPSPKVMHEIEAACGSDDVLIRQAAAEALGRVAEPRTAATLVSLLGDESKLVQRTAAWSLRQIYSRHTAEPTAPLLAAMSSANARTRWGAARVFAHHFAALARRDDAIAALEKMTSDPVLAVRMEAVKGLWQSWFWNADPAVRGRIEDTVLAEIGQPQHPWIEENLRAAVYNLADENIRYLYNNWVPLLGREEDRDRAIRGRLAVEAQLAQKFAAVLTNGGDTQKKTLLAALADLPLRRGDVYDLNADLSKEGPLIYSRIGNDIEQIAFFGTSANLLSKALLPLLDSQDPEMRRLAERASLIARETTFAAVNKLAGGQGGDQAELLAKLKTMPDAHEVVAAFLPPRRSTKYPKQVAAVSTAKRPQTKLDEAYFRLYVEPILHKKGKDGYACANCHVTHTLFNATWSTVMNVVDTADPENSLILRKPTSTAESEGVVGSKQLSHGGGVRWPKGSVEYETILRWIQGDKVESAQAH